ncbi:MAG: hypothetical protein GTO04_16060, partial [Planctomycetales bacterium]|nr:hypothetical protein [Planctomycetales bacterium]
MKSKSVVITAVIFSLLAGCQALDYAAAPNGSILYEQVSLNAGWQYLEDNT